MRLLLASALVVAVALPAFPQAPGNDDRAAAERLWETMLAAKGGRDRLMQVRSILQTTKGHYPGGFWWSKKPTDTELVRLFALPDRVWQWSDEGTSVLGLKLDVFNGELGKSFVAIPESPAREFPIGQPWDLILRAHLVYLSESSGLHGKPGRVLRGPGLSNGYDAVEVALSGAVLLPKVPGTPYRADFYLDKKNHLPAKIVTYQKSTHSPDEVAVTYELSQYREMSGIMVPDHVVEILSAARRFTWPSYNLEFNVPYREDAFTTLPSLRDGPYAWRPREIK